MRYKPGIQDDFEVLRRKQRRILRGLREANAPTGSNVYGTTSKVQAYMSDVEGIEGRLIDAEKLLADTGKRLEDVELEQKETQRSLASIDASLESLTDQITQIEKQLGDINLTTDACVLMTSDNPPSDSWKEIGYIEIGELTILHVFERV